MPTINYSGPEKITANQLFQCVLTVEFGEDIHPGGEIYIGARHTSDIGRAQNDNPAGDNYTAFSASNPSARLRFVKATGQHWDKCPWDSGFLLEVVEGGLRKGDTLTLTLGAGGRGGFRAQSFSEFKSGFRVGVLPQKGAEWIVSPVEESRMFEVTGAEAARVRAYVKDINNPGTEKTLCVKMEDIYFNTASMKNIAGLRLDVLLDDTEYVGTLDITAGATMHTLRIPCDGKWHTLSLASADGRFFCRTNPFGPGLSDGLRVFFGDLHAQSDLCDGTNRPGEIYEYAKIAAGLDLAAVTSHDCMINAAAWQEITAATKAANEPGKFVAFPGYEWSGPHKDGGDNNILFNADDGPVVHSFVSCDPWGIPGESDEKHDLRETIAKLKKDGHDFMVIPHCGGRLANFDFFDPEVMHAFEIHSCHRNFEVVWREVVRRGVKIGLCGGSDDHRGAMGDCSLSARDLYYSTHCGLICVCAEELTRAAIWEAIRKRHIYATNGPHIALDFTLNSLHRMGEEVSLPTGAALEFTCRTVTHGFFDRLEFYRNNTLEKIACYGFERGSLENQITDFEDVFADTVQPGLNFYYVKALQTDGGTAWSSPIFVLGLC